jgi:hypothetical protein
MAVENYILFYITGQWTRSKNPVILSATHHRSEPFIIQAFHPNQEAQGSNIKARTIWQIFLRFDHIPSSTGRQEVGVGGLEQR